MNEYKRVFGHNYQTEDKQNIFNKNIPDGWDILDNKNDKPVLILLNIVTNTSSMNAYKSYKLLQICYNKLNEDVKNEYKIYLVLGSDNNETKITYKIYNNKFQQEKIRFEDIKQNIKYSDKENNSYDNNINLIYEDKSVYMSMNK